MVRSATLPRLIKAPVLVWFSLAVLALFLFAALFGGVLPLPDPYRQDIMVSLELPSVEHPLGTDQLGRDILSRIVAGSRYSLIIGLGAVGLGIISGVPFGVLAGYLGGWTDRIFARVVDVFLAFPGIILALGVVAVLGPGLLSLILAVGMQSLPVFARVARAETLFLRDREFVLSARAIGLGPFGVMRRHILPNITAPIIIVGTLQIATAILIGATLTFLGVGMSPEVPEWGSMLNAGRPYMLRSPHVVLIPGITLMLVMMALNVVGDFLRDKLDPRMAGR